MIRYEWKKLLLRRRGLLLIVVLLIAELAGTLMFTQPYDRVLEENRQIYDSYLSEVEGPLTPEKREALENEMERLNTAHWTLEQAKMEYYAGEITEEEYRAAFDRLYPDDKLYVGFTTLYSQYIYVRESDNRFFLYTGGWEVLLTNQSPDYLFLLLLIILLTPVFSEEYACRMHEILLTQRKSAKYQVFSKITVALLLTLILTAILQFIDLVYCAVRFGLPNGSFTLQSVQSFGNTAKQLTLWQAFWLQFALKELGYLYAAIVILCLSVLLRKFALTLMASIAILPLPLLTVPAHDILLRVPGPWALTIGSIYLNGGSRELDLSALTLLLLVVFVAIGIMLYVIHRKNTNWQLKNRKIRMIPLFLCALAMLLTGCSHHEETVIYNRSASDWYETDDYLISGGTMGYSFIDRATGEHYGFPLTSMVNETTTCGSSVYGTGNAVYYLKTTTHRPRTGWDSVVTMCCDLVKLDLDTMKESVVYQWNEEATWFFGLLERNRREPGSLFVELQFVHGNNLYYTSSSAGSSLNRMDLRTGTVEVVFDSLNTQDLAYDGSNIYYLDSYNRLVIHTIETGAEVTIDDVVAGKFLLTPDGIYFQNRRNHLALYFWSTAEKEPVKISDLEASTVYWGEEHLWVIDQAGELFRMDHSGNNQVQIAIDTSGYRVCCICKNGDVCLMDPVTLDCQYLAAASLDIVTVR